MPRPKQEQFNEDYADAIAFVESDDITEWLDDEEEE